MEIDDPVHSAAMALILNVRPLKEEGFSVVDNVKIKLLAEALRQPMRESRSQDGFRKQPKDKILMIAIGGLRSIAYGDAQTWPNCSAREVAKQALKDSGGERYGSDDQGRRG